MNLSIQDISYKWNNITRGLCVWFLLLNMLSRFIHVVIHIRTTSFLLLKGPLYALPHCIHLSIAGHLGYFQFWVIINNTAKNIHLNFCVKVFLEYISRSGTARCYGNCMFKFFRNHQTVFQVTVPFLHSQQQCMKVPSFPHADQHCCPFYYSHPIGVN